MKTIHTKIRFAFVLAFLTLFSFSALAQEYRYETVPGDPLNVRIYTLDNGLRIYTSVYEEEPRIQTAIAVKTGSKHDPADNTGLSHYLEHLMFKGSKNIGTIDFEAESYYLNQIDSLFEVYRLLTDEQERRATYRVIDSISLLAAEYAIPNEYDRLLSALGARGTNAYTSVEQTVYINDIPSNQFDNWLNIEFERFSQPVFRLFHTELETVYEEKNMSLDNDGRMVMEALMRGLYPTHPYGTQTTLGDPEHLKNPSLLSLREYFNRRYVPNNMAIVLSGDFDPDEVLPLIDATFGRLKARPLDDFSFEPQKPITEPIIKEVYGPDAEFLRIGFRFNGVNSEDTYKLLMLTNILNNRMAGLIDLNLVQSQEVLDAGASVYLKMDYTTHLFYGRPKQGQTLEEVKELLLSQIELVKNGDFPDWYMEAVVNDYKLSEIREMESNRARNNAMVRAFGQEVPWSERVQRIEYMSQISKQDIIDFANKHYDNNYVVVYKRTGTRENVHKIEKPEITSVPINRDAQSDFAKHILSWEPIPIEPVFLDYENDITKLQTKSNIEVLYNKNEESPTFALYYVFDMGNNHHKKLTLAIEYLNYLGTSKYSPSELMLAFFRTGCRFNISTSNERVYITLSGLSENMAQGLKLLEHLLADAQPNETALKNLVDDILKKREDDKLSKSSILWSAMFNYGVFGKTNPFTNIIPEKELRKIKPEELTAIIRELNSYEHKVLYYGTHSPKELEKILMTYHKVPKRLKTLPAEKQFAELETNENRVYVVDYDMRQVDILMLSRSVEFSPDITSQVRVFNQYFGRGMSSVVFQEMREAQGLAYTAFANFRTPSRPDRHHYIMTYIATQNDKLPEATAGMHDLLNNMPVSQMSFENAKESIIEGIRTERITKASVLFNYLQARRMGYTHDIRKDIFNEVPVMNFDELKAFQQEYLKDKNYTILVLGNKDAIDIEALSEFGEIQYLSLEDIFGY